MHLKLYTSSDWDSLVRLTKAFHDASPYKPFPYEEDKVKVLADTVLAEQSCCILLMDEKEAVGFIAGTTSSLPFSNTIISVELAWWVDPSYRKGRNGFRLLEAYEYWAREVQNVDLICMVSLDDSLDKLYTRQGYTKAENAYYKEVENK